MIREEFTEPHDDTKPGVFLEVIELHDFPDMLISKRLVKAIKFDWKGENWILIICIC